LYKLYGMKTMRNSFKYKLRLLPIVAVVLPAVLLSPFEPARYRFGERSASEKPDAYMYYDDEYYPDRFDDD
ncbi:MAG: hypothetical protein K2M00_00075, partial [Muribaculaceae bacterium]|nr:hypothetical protein [Muribaculaceae bacterium]